MRTFIARSLQALVSISAVILLTGANDAGCGFGGGNETETGGGTAGAGGTSTGVVCPDGTVEQWVCGDQPTPPPCMGPDCPVSDCGTGATPPPQQGCTCAAPPPCIPGEPCEPPPPCDCPPAPECRLECVPVTNACPMGFHTETVCSVPGEPPPVDPGPDAPMPAGGGAEPGMPGEVTCVETCVPDEICPPGTVQQTVCAATEPADPNDPSMPPQPSDDLCWNECVPVEPFCPPGTHEEAVCPPDTDPQMGMPCQITCVPDQPPCPPGQHLEEQCDDQSDPSVCTISCVDDAPAN